ncbi:MAG: gluconokinase [Betaproteobacteria bacterium]
MVIIVMGAAGAGKTTIGRALATELGWQFVDADDLHPAHSVEKMRAGVPLDDRDRAPWIARIHAAIARALDRREHAVVACSALKERYRQALRSDLRPVRFVYLKASADVLKQRLGSRHGHLAGPALVTSQLADLEEPHDEASLTLDATLPAETILGAIREQFGV